MNTIVLYHLLFVLQDYFNHSQSDAFDEPIEGPLDFVVGVMNRERFLSFERMIWRISRGNIFVRQSEIEEPFKDPKTVGFVIDIITNFIQASFFLTETGRLQSCFRSLLPRRTIEVPCQENL